MTRQSPRRAACAVNAFRVTALVAASACAGGTAFAQDSPVAKPSHEQREIDALTRQLQDVQAELKELLDQNRALKRKQEELERQVAAQTGPAAPVVSTQNPSTAIAASQGTSQS